jgi:hypothetical protein
VACSSKGACRSTPVSSMKRTISTRHRPEAA